ncbi:mevalonate kinase [Thermogemmatispora sp.]|uniref:mevalonate kinase n=1 Tax=Thermogemmatispora sp. TaxID=1968838 RepID=UPI0035E3FDEF
MKYRITATAPAKLILLGEHAVNRNQAALALSLGLYATCTLSPSDGEGYLFETNGPEQRSCLLSRADLHQLAYQVDGWLAHQDYARLQALVARHFFAPAAYVLAAVEKQLPPGLRIRLSSAIPPSAGLGSGGAIFVALAAALAELLGLSRSPEVIAGWAWRGDVLAHGGTASGLDTQTSLWGGVIRYTLARQAEPLSSVQVPSLVIGHCGISASTSEVNARVRSWLAEQPTRLHYFQEIGLLVELAEGCLRAADWPRLGYLLNLNQLILERIGVSCPALERLIEAALGAGALGAKLSGSGGGGVMFALVTEASLPAVREALADAGGQPMVLPLAVPGVSVQKDPLSDPSMSLE